LRPSPFCLRLQVPINTWTNGFYMPAVRSAWNCAQFSLTACAQSQRGKSTSCNVWVPRISPRNWRFAGPPPSSRSFYLLPGPSVWVWSGASPAGTAPRNLAPPLCCSRRRLALSGAGYIQAQKCPEQHVTFTPWLGISASGWPGRISRLW
jgi:hypothetical protein